MTMYDKLGALLSEALEKGELPAQKEDSPKVQFFFVPEQKEKTDSSPHKSNQRKSDRTIEPKKILTGEVIKTKFIPENVKSALSFIGISENTGLEEAKKIYREKLMYYHPDRRADNPVLQKIAKEKTARLLKEWAVLEKWYEN
ncbi:MAG: hypothetical protein IJ630_09105 [Treponema sp.]|nr:hypothetical protein [Treponema sp.]